MLHLNIGCSGKLTTAFTIKIEHRSSLHLAYKQANARHADVNMQEGQTLEEASEKQEGNINQSEQTNSQSFIEPQHSAGNAECYQEADYFSNYANYLCTPIHLSSCQRTLFLVQSGSQ